MSLVRRKSNGRSIRITCRLPSSSLLYRRLEICASCLCFRQGPAFLDAAPTTSLYRGQARTPSRGTLAHGLGMYWSSTQVDKVHLPPVYMVVVLYSVHILGPRARRSSSGWGVDVMDGCETTALSCTDARGGWGVEAGQSGMLYMLNGKRSPRL